MMCALVGMMLVLLGHIMMLVSFVTVWEVHAMYTRKQRQHPLLPRDAASRREREIVSLPSPTESRRTPRTTTWSAVG